LNFQGKSLEKKIEILQIKNVNVKEKKTEYILNIEIHHKMSQHFKIILFFYTYIMARLVIFNMNICLYFHDVSKVIYYRKTTIKYHFKFCPNLVLA